MYSVAAPAERPAPGFRVPKQMRGEWVSGLVCERAARPDAAEDTSGRCSACSMVAPGLPRPACDSRSFERAASDPAFSMVSWLRASPATLRRPRNESCWLLAHRLADFLSPGYWRTTLRYAISDPIISSRGCRFLCVDSGPRWAEAPSSESHMRTVSAVRLSRRASVFCSGLGLRPHVFILSASEHLPVVSCMRYTSLLTLPSPFLQCGSALYLFDGAPRPCSMNGLWTFDGLRGYSFQAFISPVFLFYRRFLVFFVFSWGHCDCQLVP